MHAPSELFTLPANIETRWINPENPTGARGAACAENHGRKGHPCYGGIEAGETLTVADYRGTSGVIRHIWTTIESRAPEMLRGLMIEFFWDGAKTPAIRCPYGDFFGLALGRLTPFESCFFTSPEGRDFNCHIPMPFREGFRVTVTNQTNARLGLFWAQFDLTINDPIPAGTPYLHAVHKHQNPTTMREDFEFLPLVKGKGRYLGCNFGVRVDTDTYFRSWWGEGEVKLYVDGDAESPTLCGTGTEDYICTAWGQGKYDCLRYGCPVADEKTAEYCFYRYHLDDPVYFHQSIRGTIQQIGCWDPDNLKKLQHAGRQLMKAGEPGQPWDLEAQDLPPWALFERADDWSSCAYFYLDSPA